MTKNEKKKWRDKKNKMLKRIKDEINDDDKEMTQEDATALAKELDSKPQRAVRVASQAELQPAPPHSI